MSATKSAATHEYAPSAPLGLTLSLSTKPSNKWQGHMSNWPSTHFGMRLLQQHCEGTMAGVTADELCQMMRLK